MEKFLERTYKLIGDKVSILQNSTIAVIGVGGVGGYVVEALARCGVGKLIIVDNDKVSLSNINRQIIALNSTIGEYKVDVAEKRIKDINPNCVVEKHKTFILKDTINDLQLDNCNYVVDAIDTISGKLEIIKKCKTNNINIISCMGTGNKIDPTAFMIKDIFDTKICPVCKVMRKLLKQNNISSLKVLYSIENPLTPLKLNNDDNEIVPASISFVPSVAGLLIANEVVKDLTKFYGNGKNFS